MPSGSNEIEDIDKILAELKGESIEEPTIPKEKKDDKNPFKDKKNDENHTYEYVEKDDSEDFDAEW